MSDVQKPPLIRGFFPPQKRIIFPFSNRKHLSSYLRFSTMWYVQPTKTPICMGIPSVWSEPLLVASIFYRLLSYWQHNMEFLSLKGGCTGSSESIHVKMPHCWKFHVVAHLEIILWNASCQPKSLDKQHSPRSVYFLRKLHYIISSWRFSKRKVLPFFIWKNPPQLKL